MIQNNKYFGSVIHIEEHFTVSMTKAAIVDARKSHDALYRKSNGKFDDTIEAISKSLLKDEYVVPYSTSIWASQRSEVKK